MGGWGGQRGRGGRSGYPCVQGSRVGSLGVHLREDEARRRDNTRRKQDAEWGPVTANRSDKYHVFDPLSSCGMLLTNRARCSMRNLVEGE